MRKVNTTRYPLQLTLATLVLVATSIIFTACDFQASSPVSSSESSSSLHSDNTLSSSSVSAPWLPQSSSSSRTQPSDPVVSISSSSKLTSSSSVEMPSGDLISCDMHINMQMTGESFSAHFCAEIPISSLTEEEKSSCTSEESLGLIATLGTSCPSGAVLKCPVTEEGVTGISYFYDAQYEDMTCEEATAE